MDRLWIALDSGLRTLFAQPHGSTPAPAAATPQAPLAEAERQLSAALMRVNHVGEVCAQALYMGQATVTRNAPLRRHLLQAAREEGDHLAWTQQRLEQLHDRPSLLNPLWYTGAFALGAAAGWVSDRVSLGFVAETEKQVAEHLQDHLERLPVADQSSRAIVAQMKRDEEQHAAQAHAAGAVDLPLSARLVMRAAAKVMTTTAHYI